MPSEISSSAEAFRLLRENIGDQLECAQTQIKGAINQGAYGQWARNPMREEGLIRDGSPRGTWAISEKGRRWLENRSSAQ